MNYWGIPLIAAGLASIFMGWFGTYKLLGIPYEGERNISGNDAGGDAHRGGAGGYVPKGAP